MGGSAANNHFEAHVRLPPTDDDDDESDDTDSALNLVLQARVIAWTLGAVCGSLDTRNRLSNIRALMCSTLGFAEGESLLAEIRRLAGGSEPLPGLVDKI